MRGTAADEDARRGNHSLRMINSAQEKHEAPQQRCPGQAPTLRDYLTGLYHHEDLWADEYDLAV
jgi:hypothetical protein